VSELTGPAKAIAVQATSYLRAVYGKDLVYKAPETFPALERWVLALARGDFEWAEQLMDQTIAAIEESRRSREVSSDGE